MCVCVCVCACVCVTVATVPWKCPTGFHLSWFLCSHRRFLRTTLHTISIVFGLTSGSEPCSQVVVSSSIFVILTRPDRSEI